MVLCPLCRSSLISVDLIPVKVNPYTYKAECDQCNTLFTYEVYYCDIQVPVSGLPLYLS